MTTASLRRPIFEEITDERVRESIQWMYEYLLATPLLQGRFEHFSITTIGAVTNLKIPHTLGFAPKDIIQTSITSATFGASVIFAYSSFTPEYIVLTTSAPLTVRFFGGSYELENL